MAVFTWSKSDISARMDALSVRLEENESEVQNIFTQTFLDGLLVKQISPSNEPLEGALVSVKDLLDVEGYVTRAGTTFMQKDAPAKADAFVVTKMRDAGATIVGHTNMTELAYSGLGLNPHYGTPKNAITPDAIPGGSTSGGAISVAQGLVDIAIGSDTGGSLRIPAAFNRIVGFKPTQTTVSRDGCKALSRSLDSIGPMAKTVAECGVAYECMHSEDAPQQAIEREFVIPTNFGFDDIDPVIDQAFSETVEILLAKGYSVSHQYFEVLETYKTLPVWHFSAVECRAEYENSFQSDRLEIDPLVSSRMSRADEVSAIEYAQTLNLRADLISKFEAELGSKVLIMPTTPILPPKFSEVTNPDEYGKLNLLALRNPSLANVMNGCSISIPMGSSTTPAGLMLTCGAHRDIELLKFAAEIEDL